MIRALEVCLSCGQPYSDFRREQIIPRPFNCIKIMLNRARPELYNRINQRVDWMIQNGLLEEARQLYPLKKLNALQTVGYKELFDHIEGKFSLVEAIERIKRNTRRYAKRQLTWFRKDTDFQWFHPDEEKRILAYILETIENSQ